ncbi:hypothetical protein CLV93_10645 [Prolixibacter denitrificans]|uniref:Uncharacterized protein n=1 Tax=Prolixibacter denitrificans TaxID=1541063 RepID=A0A2P8CBG1_9BACT|nr:hypothetical protein CLV93_10645 [Prolixibacter denitrificans]
MKYFLLKWYQIVYYLRKDEAGAKHSAYLYLSAYVSFFILSVINIAGRKIDSSFGSYLATPNFIIWMSVFILVPVVLYVPYYRNLDVSRIKSRYQAKGKIARLIIDIIVYLMILGIPVLTFLLYWFVVEIF